MTQTYIPGKDAALETSIATMQQRLITLGFDIEEASWLNPVPNVWSVHIRDRSCPACFTNGKGASRDAALASALGEFFERLACNYFFADFYLGSKVAQGEFVHYPNEQWFALSQTRPEGLMNQALWDHYDPDGDLAMSTLVDMQSGNRERGICALPFVRQRDQQTTYIPMNIVGNLFVSNGMSAGNTPTEARTQALSECFERYVKNRIISEAISLPQIPDAVMARYPNIQEAIATLEREGFPIYCFDASLGGQFPVICVTLFNPINGGCFASFGAHPRFEVALERTVTELLQGRSLKDLDIFPTPSMDNDDIADPSNLETHFIDSSGLVSWDLFRVHADYPFTDWNFAGTSEQEFNHLLDKFHTLGADVYIADYSHLETYACRVLVPGYSEVYPVYELAFVNNNRGQTLRECISEWLDSPSNASLALSVINEINHLDLDEFYPLSQILGISVDASSPWATLRIGELLCLLYLALSDHEQAREWAQWTTDFNANAISADRQLRLRFYHALQALLELEQTGRHFNDYQAAFERLYGQHDLNLARAHIQGEKQGYDLLLEHRLTEFTKHQKLLETYQKLQRAKAQYAQQ
ncbi:30S ribosomal protein S12 methylthiotransferase accessory factor YcaO [Celerinatantimonas yamalensis]|uniref:30S ribosomal protein S12 methylthiotransferase accessory factor YcaO n=1 Tax=Celerinatantimonas yamalensis TaxID=559956 RepID=A0ABW9GC34_9GAMM